MYRQRKAAKRFTLLLLEEEEDYVQDWVATCKWPASVSGCWSGSSTLEGRVRLCTRSLFFDPDDVRVPIVRLPFNATELLEGSGNTLTMRVTSLTKMKANMEEVPYVFEKGQASTWQFTLLYAPLNALLPMAQQLVAANKQPKAKRTLELEAFVRSREDGVAFDTSRLADFSERILLDVPAIQLTPLVRERGHLVLTDTRLYFQPMHNVSGDVPVRSHPLAGVAAFARRRSCLRPLGLELFFVRPSDTSAATMTSQTALTSGLSSSQSSASNVRASVTSLADLELMSGGQVWDAPSAFFAFRTPAEREAVATQLSQCPHLGSAVVRLSTSPSAPPAGFSSLVQAQSLLLEAQGGWLHKVTAAWQAAKVSNFDYLLYLNLAAGRSFNDLAQWPVFPWVLKNWVSQTLDLNDPTNYRDLSKPIGALNQARLREFRKRFEEMPHDLVEEGAIPPFMYGTHYSTPGYTMYWLLRAAPAHMLRLQNGRFDAPDRLFHSLRESWDSVNNSTTDVKELIPEFYLPGGSWLQNLQRLPLGVRQSGQPIVDVELPPWARDPEHFLAVHRAALESPPVSQTLHNWIDLVFGYKQTGPAAETANNVFYHLTYEGAVDVGKVTDPIELKALETQINEFGQTPRQLFQHPHPPRRVVPPAPDPAAVFQTLVTDAAAGGGGIGFTAPGNGLAGAVSQTAAGGGVAGTESGHRALAMALISALTQALAMPEDCPGTPPPAPAAPAPAAAMTGSSPAASTSATATPRSISGVGTGGQGTPSSSGPSPAPVPPPTTTGGSVVGGIFSGLLKLGRYQNARTSSNASSPPLSGRAETSSLPAPIQAPEAPAAGAPAFSATVSEPVPRSTTTASAHTVASHTASAASAGTSGLAPQQHSRPDFNLAGVAPAHWGEGLPDRLWACQDASTSSRCQSHSLPLSRAGVSGVAGWRSRHSTTGACTTYVACGGSGGHLRVASIQWGSPVTTSTTNHSVIRSIQLDGDLLCLVPLSSAASAGTAHAAGAAEHAQHPLLLAGSHNQRVYAYDVSKGQLLGSFQAHDDAVCCLALPPLKVNHHPTNPTWDHTTLDPPGRFFTSSWDCTVKAWPLAESRQPWSWSQSSVSSQPEVVIDLGEGVWALAAGEEGSHLVVAGTEEGKVLACDLRAGKAVWTAQVAQDYIGGMALSPGGRYLSCGMADGSLALLDMRASGSRVALAATESPIRCCTSDGTLLLAGTEAGLVQLWDVALGDTQHSSGAPAGTALGGQQVVTPPAPDGLYTPWTPTPAVGGGSPAVTSLHVIPWFTEDGRVCAQVAAGREDGSVVAALCG